MTKINWKVRLLSPKFWLALVPVLLLLVQTIATPLGYKWDFAGIGTTLTGIVNAVFGVLTILGVVTDPTTKGLTDSDRALTYGKDAPVDTAEKTGPSGATKEEADANELQVK